MIILSLAFASDDQQKVTVRVEETETPVVITTREEEEEVKDP